jgi:hypothetical protein
MKNLLGTQRFSNSDEMMEGVETWLSPRVTVFFATGIESSCPV